jgi:ZIP family zinc transporter
MLFLSVTLHNIPEGMAVGVVYAATLASGVPDGLSGAFALSLGIAAQNLPEGAIISMPQASVGIGKWRAFISGTLSGIVEPLSAVATLLALKLILPALPYLLGFAAGAMIYAVIKELAPIISSKGGDSLGAISFTSGFSLMMILDVILG